MVDSAQQTTDAIQPQVQQQLQSSMQYMNQMRSGVHIYVMQEPPGPQFNGFSGPSKCTEKSFKNQRNFNACVLTFSHLSLKLEEWH